MLRRSTCSLVLLLALAVAPRAGADGWALDTPLSDAHASFWGEFADDQAGYCVAGVGDVNGDGYDDMLVGVPENDEAGSGAGQAYLLLGSAAGWVLDDSLGNADASYLGEAAEDEAGFAVAGAGDIDGDNLDDLLIGAYQNDEVATNAGQVYVVFGANGGWSQDTSLASAGASFRGEDVNEEGGYSVASAGDVDGDGFGDFIVGAVGYESGSYAGKTYLILGRAFGWQADVSLGAADASFLGEDDQDYSGASIDGVGDVNGDGLDDFLVGAYGNDAVDSNAGQAYLVLGRAAGWALDVGLGQADASFLGEVSGDRAGPSVAGAGDVNGDGYDDLLVGAYANDDGGTSAGKTYLVLGKAAGWTVGSDLAAADASFLGEASNDLSGTPIAGAGDADGDGLDDFLVGAFGNDDAGSYAGQSYLFMGDAAVWGLDTSLAEANASFLGEQADDWSGWSVDGAGDVNGDGYDDLVIGANHSSEADSQAGQVYLVLGEPFCTDLDGDGYGDPGVFTCLNGAEDDCDDGDPTIYPGADEYCNGVDDDCDGAVDEDGAVDSPTWYLDVDGDGFGNALVTYAACASPTGYVADNTDCDDNDSGVHPGAAEICDGKDNDCLGDVDEDDAIDATAWYLDADLDGYGDPATVDVECVQPAGYVADGSDCNDADATSFPGADEYCDGIDHDCDTLVYEDHSLDAPIWYADGDGDGFGDPYSTATACFEPVGYLADATDCDDGDPGVYPGAPEYCNGVDDDCDGTVDEDDALDALTWYLDADGDGYGDPSLPTLACDTPPGYVAGNGDCDDTNPWVNPGQAELCDGVDNNCDGVPDPDEVDGDGDGWMECSGDCDDTNAGIFPGAAEAHDGEDNDCNDLVDDGVLPYGGLLITEIMYDPEAVADFDGEWFEVHNDTGYPINLYGFDVYDDAFNMFTVGHDVWIDAGGFAVLGANGDQVTNGGVLVDYEYSIGDFHLGNGDDAIHLELAGLPVDSVEYEPGNYWPVASGASVSLDPAKFDESYNDFGTHWCATHAWPEYMLDGGDYATPGLDNPSCCPDWDGDGYLDAACGGDDCDDDDPAVYPGAPEVCDGQADNDCDGLLALDEIDADYDGHSICDGDCDDADPTSWPGAPELCDGIDNDCDGYNDEGTTYDWDGDGLTACEGDCDDTDGSVLPGAPEICDGKDSDCDGAIPPIEADADGDGAFLCGGDCDDNDATVYPGAAELCDGIDNDCNGITPFEVDVDADGYMVCENDCDDGDPAVNPSAAELCNGVDDDCDGFPDPGETDVDGDGFMVCSGDCDDSEAAANPGMAEIACDGIDNDCEPLTPDADDGDGDGYDECVDCDDSIAALNWDDMDGDGASPCHGDCDDGDPDVAPGIGEECDGIDNDCDPATDENDDADGDGFSECEGDCDDEDEDLHPDAVELCDGGLDNDCNPATDEIGDYDGDGISVCGGDCDDEEPDVHPGAPEVCDGLDNNCNGSLMNGEVDDDGDGWLLCDGDCDDSDPISFPGAPEQCDGLDNDCDTFIDEDADEDLDGDHFNACQGDCDNLDPHVYPGAPEICDGKDSDCDGATPPDEADDDGDGSLICDGDCDDSDPTLNLEDLDGDGFTSCNNDCDDEQPFAFPGNPETCDGIDNDCDGNVDDVDADGDGHVAEACGGEDCDDGDGAVNPDEDEDCTDGEDNDCDGLVDDEDDECAGDDDTTGDDDTSDDDDDTEPLDDDDDDGGCECQNDLSGGAVAGGPLALLALFGAAGLRRRVRRS